MWDYWYYGLRLRSDLPLRGLPPCPADLDLPVFVLRRGPVPDQIAAGAEATRRLSCDDAGRILLKVPGLFRLSVVDDSEALIAIAPGAAGVEIEGYLLSYVAGVVLHRRRAFPLHASGVVIDGRAVALCGPSGRGKSTLATALSRAGHRLLSDDIIVIRFDPAGDVVAVPGSPHARLDADSAAAVALDPAVLAEGREGDRKKIWYRNDQGFDPVPLAAVIRLELATPVAPAGLTRMTGPGALLPLEDVVYRFALGCRLGAAGDLAFAALRLAARVPVLRLARARDFEALDAAAALIVEAAGR